MPAAPIERIRAILDLIELHTQISPGADQRMTHLAALGELAGVLRPAVSALENRVAADAFAHGATQEDLARAAGLTDQAARDRWGDLTICHCVVVISHQARAQETQQDDPRAGIGEMGVPAQYDADRGVWRVGVHVRTCARHAVIAVGGSVRRVYEIDPDGWEPNPGGWSFRAVGERALSPVEVDDLYADGELPYHIGSPCPTTAGGPYRPERFWPVRERAARWFEP